MANQMTNPGLGAIFVHDARRAVETFLKCGQDTINIEPEELPTAIGYRGAIRKISQFRRFNDKQENARSISTAVRTTHVDKRKTTTQYQKLVALRGVLKLLHDNENTLATPLGDVINDKLQEHGEEIIKIVNEGLTKKEFGTPSTSKKIEVRARTCIRRLLTLVFPSYEYNSEQAVRIEAKKLRKGPDKNTYVHRIVVDPMVWSLAQRSDYYTHKVKTNKQVVEELQANQNVYRPGSRKLLWRTHDGLVDEVFFDDDVELTIPLNK